MTVLRIMVIAVFITNIATTLYSHPMPLCEVELKLEAAELLKQLKLRDDQIDRCRQIARKVLPIRERSLLSWRSHLEEGRDKPKSPLGGEVTSQINEIITLLTKSQLEVLRSFGRTSPSPASHDQESLVIDDEFDKELSKIRRMSEGQWRHYQKDISEELKRIAAQADREVSDGSASKTISRYMLSPSFYPSASKQLEKVNEKIVPTTKSWWKPQEKWETKTRNNNAVLP